MEQILLCTDLDRTLIPNGLQPESPAARPLFKQLVAEPSITLAYVSGRDLGLLKEAIVTYQLPEPDFMIGDVGTTIFSRSNDDWEEIEEWQDLIAEDWAGCTPEDIIPLLNEVGELELQEPDKQNRFKLSYYTDWKIDPDKLKDGVRKKLAGCPARISLIHSVDEVNRIGLFDLLPESATKLHGIRFLAEKTAVSPDRIIYAGDSGNDLEVLTSETRSVLVANATDLVRSRAVEIAPEDTLYLARGNFMAMNGNYAAGILEGLGHYLPETLSLLEKRQFIDP
jgi:HAD superfamily hydrolase (TIGR01484 family)